MCHVVKNSLPRKRGEIAAKRELLSPSEGHKKTKKTKKTPDLARGGKSNDIAHCSIIWDFTVSLV